MRNSHTLLAGIAALALFAAGGIASAQQNQQGAGSAAQSSAQSQRSQQGTRNQSANQGMRNRSAQQGGNQNAMSRQSSGQNAQNQSRMQSRQGSAGRTSNRSAQQQNRNRGTSATNRTAQGQRQNQRNAQSQNRNRGASATNRTAQGQQGQQQNQRNAQRNRTQRGTSTAQRNQQLRGLQGSTRAPMQGANEQQRGAGGANVSLNDQQRTQIRDTVINSRNAPRVNNPNFSVNVGTVVPRGRIRLVRVPPMLVRIHPGWRRFVYFVYNDQIVIVDPRTNRIVNVLPV